MKYAWQWRESDISNIFSKVHEARFELMPVQSMRMFKQLVQKTRICQDSNMRAPGSKALDETQRSRFKVRIK